MKNIFFNETLIMKPEGYPTFDQYLKDVDQINLLQLQKLRSTSKWSDDRFEHYCRGTHEFAEILIQGNHDMLFNQYFAYVRLYQDNIFPYYDMDCKFYYTDFVQEIVRLLLKTNWSKFVYFSTTYEREISLVQSLIVDMMYQYEYDLKEIIKISEKYHSKPTVNGIIEESIIKGDFEAITWWSSQFYSEKNPCTISTFTLSPGKSFM